MTPGTVAMRVGRGGLALLLVLLLTGCLNVPTAGPLLPGPSPSPDERGPVEIEPAPPAPDASAQLVVEGFLHAMASFRTGDPVALEYLSEDARARWQPEGVLVYGDDAFPRSSGDQVVLSATLVAELAPDGAFQRTDRPYRIDFGLVRDADGQWRIDDPPDGLLVSQYLFQRFYDRFDTYFFDPDFTTLVPDPIYVPRGEQSATTLVDALLDGPTEWLAPGVVSAFPSQTELGLSIPVTADGVAEVSLSQAVEQLAPEERDLMAAQVVWTLRQLSQIRSVRFLVAGVPFAVPGQGADGTVPVGTHAQLGPVPAGPDATLHVAVDGGIARLVEPGPGAELGPVPGPFGELAQTPASFAVAAAPSGRLAVVDQQRERVMVAEAVVDAGTTEVLRGEGLLRPQFNADVDLWLAESGPTGSQFHLVVDGEVTSVAAPDLDEVEVLAFRLSPDGARMAVLTTDPEQGTALGLLVVEQGEGVALSGYREVPLVSNTERELAALSDVGWADAGSLLLLARAEGETVVLPWRVDSDGAELVQVGPGGWEPVALTVDPGQNAPRAVVLDAEGVLWQRQGDFRWVQVPLGAEVTAVAYPH